MTSFDDTPTKDDLPLYEELLKMVCMAKDVCIDSDRIVELKDMELNILQIIEKVRGL